MTTAPDFDIVRELTSDLFQSEFLAAFPSTPIQFENVKFTQPKTKWVDFSVLEGTAHRTDLNPTTSRWRTFGVINIQLMVPEDTGTKVLNQMAARAFAIFADKNIAVPGGGKISCCKVDKRSRPKINGFACKSVQVEFHYDFTFAR